MISGYPCELYENRLSEWERRELRNVTHAGTRSEVVWANFGFSTTLHDYSRIGSGFRERERIKRKTARWIRNLQRMPEIERRAIVAAIQSAPDLGHQSGDGNAGGFR
jgi:DNA adenine methylase